MANWVKFIFFETLFIELQFSHKHKILARGTFFYKILVNGTLRFLVQMPQSIWSKPLKMWSNIKMDQNSESAFNFTL
jgi:hypothetical protein